MPPKRSASMAGNSCDIRSFFKPKQATTSSSSPITTGRKAAATAQSANRESTTPPFGTEMDSATSREPPAVGMSLPALSADSSIPPAVGMSPSTHSELGTVKEQDLSTDSSSGRPMIPFAPHPLHSFVCPFKAQGETCRSDTFKDISALATHCRKKHPGRIIVPFDDNPTLQDGTERIPCQKGCGSLFSTYNASMAHSKNCSNATDTAKDCPWPGCMELSMELRAYGTHAGMHVTDPRGLYRCSKCPKLWYDLYLLASHESRCKGEESSNNARFDGVHRAKYLPKSKTGNARGVLAVARSSSAAPKAWKSGEEDMAKGLTLFTKKVFDTLVDDHGSNLDVPGTLIALYDVHTSCAPTGKFSQAHTTIDPSIRSYYARAYKFTNAIDKSLEDFAARGINPFLLSIGLDGFACKADLILPWLQRSPSFTLIIRETELVYGMDIAYFPQHDSGFYYGFFESHDLLVGLSTDTAVDDGVKNLLAAWKACQDWKDYGQAHNGRLIGRNGDPQRVLKKSKRGPKILPVVPTSVTTNFFEPA